MQYTPCHGRRPGSRDTPGARPTHSRLLDRRSGRPPLAAWVSQYRSRDVIAPSYRSRVIGACAGRERDPFLAIKTRAICLLVSSLHLSPLVMGRDTTCGNISRPADTAGPKGLIHNSLALAPYEQPAPSAESSIDKQTNTQSLCRRAKRRGK